jgi:alpha-beta hydrolase superfamily lysophospholipase
MVAGAMVTVIAALMFYLQSHPDLSIWHTADLDEEFTMRRPAATFEDYLKMEARLFAQLDEKIFRAVGGPDQHRINRFSRGSLADPARWPVNWNRTYEWPVSRPKAGALLLHGLSDSPYSLRQLGQQLSAAGVRVLGLRIPGHGTAPSALARTTWQDMAAAVRLAMRHLKEELQGQPVYLVGYSNGGALAIHYVLAALEDPSLPQVAGVVLISPEIGLSKAAAFAVWQARLGRWLHLPKLAWHSVLPEFDPFKYNSFAINAGDQAYRLTSTIQRQLTACAKAGLLARLPPILAFQSVADTTVRSEAVIDELFDRLPPGKHALVFFDINQITAVNPLLDGSARQAVTRLLERPDLTYELTFVTNENPTSREVAAYQKRPGLKDPLVVALEMQWPADVYSLSHVALPFAPHDPLYGGSAADPSPGIQLGHTVLRGENGLLRADPAMLLRLRWNPFYGYLAQRVTGFIQ